MTGSDELDVHHNRDHECNHGLDAIVTALVEAGMELTRLQAIKDG